MLSTKELPIELLSRVVPSRRFNLLGTNFLLLIFQPRLLLLCQKVRDFAHLLLMDHFLSSQDLTSSQHGCLLFCQKPE